ncbi:hypothetical protein [Dactylosporangium sp. CS-033363]|uniref:hypothetical protein n=1 Tax=Dactylosporangium sp. CS-033363 TaxID=3239935 RepID=UPI003D94A061
MTGELQPVDHYLTGPADQLANVLRSAHARGHLVRYGRPQPLGNGRFAIDVTLLEPVPERKGRRRAAQVAVVLGGLALVGGIGWGVWLLVTWVMTHWLVICGTIALVLVVAALMVGNRDTHCRGCGHR